MPVPASTNYLKIHLTTVRLTVLGTNQTFDLPVWDFEMKAIPWLGQDGSTAQVDFQGDAYYKAFGWRHDVTLEWPNLSEAASGVLYDFIIAANSAQSAVRLNPADRDPNGTITVDTTRSVDLVPDFKTGLLQAVFRGIGRDRGARLDLRGATILAQPLAWMK